MKEHSRQNKWSALGGSGGQVKAQQIHPTGVFESQVTVPLEHLASVATYRDTYRFAGDTAGQIFNPVNSAGDASSDTWTAMLERAARLVRLFLGG